MSEPLKFRATSMAGPASASHGDPTQEIPSVSTNDTEPVSSESADALYKPPVIDIRKLPNWTREYLKLTEDETLHYFARRVKIYLSFQLIFPRLGMITAALLLAGTLWGSSYVPTYGNIVGGAGIVISSLIFLGCFFWSKALKAVWRGRVLYHTNLEVKIVQHVPGWVSMFGYEDSKWSLPTYKLLSSGYRRGIIHRMLKTGKVTFDGAGTEDRMFHGLTGYPSVEELSDIGNYYAKKNW